MTGGTSSSGTRSGAIEDGAGDDRLDLDALYPYTADRLSWLASHLDRPGYCDEAAADAGGPPGEILAFVAWGMDRELREVFGLVRSKLGEIAGDEDADTDPATDPNADARAHHPGRLSFIRPSRPARGR